MGLVSDATVRIMYDSALLIQVGSRFELHSWKKSGFCCIVALE